MKIALMDSGIGLLAAAAALRELRPDADLVLSTDPDGMPWGPRTPADVTEHALAVARAAAARRPDALIVACNTASVHALDAIRAELEPGIPVIGTVPAIKPAAAAGGPVAIWATPAGLGALVLGCTHYELVAEQIRAALGEPEDLVLYGSAQAVAVQALRRAQPGADTDAGGGSGDGTLLVLGSGRVVPLPAAARSYREGRLLLSEDLAAPVGR